MQRWLNLPPAEGDLGSSSQKAEAGSISMTVDCASAGGSIAGSSSGDVQDWGCPSFDVAATLNATVEAAVEGVTVDVDVEVLLGAVASVCS